MDVGDAVPFQEFVAILRRHLVVMIVGAALGVGVAAYFVIVEWPQYRATAVIRLTEGEQQTLAGGLTGQVAQQAFGASTDPILSQIQVLRSRTVIGAVVDGQGLRLRTASRGFPRSLVTEVGIAAGVTADTIQLAFAARSLRATTSSQEDVPTATSPAEAAASYGEVLQVGGIRFAVRAPPDVDEATLHVLPRQEAIDAVLLELNARRRDRTNVVDVEFVAHDPRHAQQVANAITGAFQALSANTAQQQARRRRTFVEEQLRETESVLVQAQLALSEFRRREEAFSTREKYAAQQAGLMALEVRREELAADGRMLRSLLAQLEAAPPDGAGTGLGALIASPGVAANPVITQLFGQLLRYEASLDSLTTGSWASARTNPDVERLVGMAAETRGRLVNAVRSHVDALDARIAALDELRARNAAEMRVLPEVEAEEARLAQQVGTIREVADLLREELQRARIAEAVEAGSVEIVDPAVLPSEPIESGRVRTLIFGLFLGLFFAGGAAFLLEQFNTSIHRRDEIEPMLEVPGLVVVPQIAGSSNGRARRLPTMAGRLAALGANGSGNGAGVPGLVTVTDMHSPSAEAYRTLRTNLIFSQAVRTLKRIVVTSSAPAEGKTTTAANLAVAFAQQGVRVLLLDCDLRRPRLHTVFRVPQEPGLTQVLLGHYAAEAAILESGVDGLSVLTAGTLPPNPSEILGGDRMRSLLDVAVESFDLLILDSPPVLAASDAAILGTMTDGVLLVLRAGQTQRDEARQTVRQLGAVGARVVGAILNDPDARVPRYGPVYNYTYAYQGVDG